MEGEKTRDSSALHLHRLLATERRRELLQLVYEHDGGNVKNLTSRLAASERTGSEAGSDEERRERIAISLIHNHLPRLADHDLIEYDQRSGDVVVTDRFAALEPVIQQLGGEDGEVGSPSERPAQERGFQATAGW